MRLGFLLKLSILILLRSWRATAVLSFMVISAVTALVFLSSLAVGTNDAMIRNSTGLFSGQITGSVDRASETLRLAIPGVERVLVRRHQQMLVWQDEAVEPILLMGVDPVAEKENTALWKKTVSGRYLLPGEEAIYLSEATAQRLNLSVGGKVQLGARPGTALKTLTVVGIYKTGITQLDQGMAFCPREAFPLADGSIAVAVFVQAGTSPDDIVAQYRHLVSAGTFTAWTEFMPDLQQLIDLDSICMAIVMVLVFAIVSVGISCAFLIFTLKNLREHGIMKAMGLMSGDTALLLVLQIGLLTLCAALLGTVTGVAAVTLCAHIGIDISAFTSHNQYFAVSGVLYPRLTATALFTPPLLALVFGLAAAVWPTLYIIRKNPADILRSV